MAETDNKILQKDKKRMVKAMFSYTPVNIDELQLKVNDILEVIEETEEGWWKGILNGNVGMFPSNFVIELDILPEELNNYKANEFNTTKASPKVKNMDQNSSIKHDNILSSNKLNTKPPNEDVTDTTKGSEMDNKIMLNKKNVDTTAPRLPPKPVREQARVIYPYTALNEDELSLKEGDIITIISKEVEDKGWWKGELNNKTGVFPDNFVQLIKVEEQKKPERPDKPSTAILSKASLKSSTPEKPASEFSPKSDKKMQKTPPLKPPPPEVHRKESERPSPPFPSKKPQVPHPMKKPMRPSLGTKFTGSKFSPPVSNSLKSPPTENSPESASPPSVMPVPANDTKPEIIKNSEKPAEKEEKKNKDIDFEGLESSGKKLIHLTANRAKHPNRRPPSHIFLRETEKENGVSVDPRRLSEPLLSEMKSIIQLGEEETYKASTLPSSSESKSKMHHSSESKAKIPPSRPMPPSIKGNKPALQGSVLLTKTISSEECIVKAPEPIKKTLLDSSASDISPLKRIEPISTDVKTQSYDKELKEIKENVKALMDTMVSKKEFQELANQVKELKESMEKSNSNHKKVINDLKNELEQEKKLRESLEVELQLLKEKQTT